MGAVLLAAAIVVSNALTNRWRPFHGWAYLPVNLASGSSLLAIGALAFGLNGEEMGLSFDGASLGALFALPVLVALAVASTRSTWRRLLADARYAGIGVRDAAFIVLVRIPVGTALFEEVAFRGVLFGAFQREGTLAASIATSIAFGLWHLEPTRLLARANRPAASRRVVSALVAGGVLVTVAAGALFAFLRVAGGGIAAPAVFHAIVNASGALAAIAAHRHR